MGAPWVCLTTDQSISDPATTQSSPMDSTHPINSAPSEGGDCDGDDGPEYLAIGNLGRRNRRGSSSSAQSGEHAQTRGHAPEAPPPSQRRSSFSDMERGKGRSSKGHTRSMSDTGVMQKQKQGKRVCSEIICITACKVNSFVYPTVVSLFLFFSVISLSCSIIYSRFSKPLL